MIYTVEQIRKALYKHYNRYICSVTLDAIIKADYAEQFSRMMTSTDNSNIILAHSVAKPILKEYTLLFLLTIPFVLPTNVKYMKYYKPSHLCWKEMWAERMEDLEMSFHSNGMQDKYSTVHYNDAMQQDINIRCVDKNRRLPLLRIVHRYNNSLHISNGNKSVKVLSFLNISMRGDYYEYSVSTHTHLPSHIEHKPLSVEYKDLGEFNRSKATITGDIVEYVYNGLCKYAGRDDNFVF